MDYIYAVQLIKAWKAYHKENHDNEFPLKSFLIECQIFDMYEKHKKDTLFDIIFRYFSEKVYLNMPTCPIDSNKLLFPNMIKKEELIEKLEPYIIGFMTSLEDIDNKSVKDLIQYSRKRKIYQRKDSQNTKEKEEFLFDFCVPMFIEKKPSYIIKVHEQQETTNNIIFFKDETIYYPEGTQFSFELNGKNQVYWKVLNDTNHIIDDSFEMRGTISIRVVEKETLSFHGCHVVERFILNKAHPYQEKYFKEKIDRKYLTDVFCIYYNKTTICNINSY